jgi:hypothetical protein
MHSISQARLLCVYPVTIVPENDQDVQGAYKQLICKGLPEY